MAGRGGGGGGGADEYVRSAKYEYRPNSNLVLESDAKRSRNNEPTGEVESLVGKLGERRMGDRVARSRPAELDERLEKAKKKRDRTSADADAEAAALKRGRRAAGEGGRGFLDQLEQLEGVTYRPRTKETRAIYEQLLTIVQRAIGDQPQEILCGAAEEVLSTLKSADVREREKKSRVEQLLGPLTEDAFSRIVNLGKGVSDFSADGQQAASAEGGGERSGAPAPGGIRAAATLDEDVGVAVVFEDEDEEGADGVDEVRDDEEEEEEDGEDAAVGAGLAAGDGEGDAGGTGAAEVDASEEAAGLIPVHKIDAFWLQRELNKYYSNDATASQRLAGEVLAILGEALARGEEGEGEMGEGGALDLREAENKLVALLDYDKFDLVKAVLRNAARLFYVTRLRQAQTDGERESVRAEMAADARHGGRALLAALDRTQTSDSWVADRTTGVTDRVRKEARELGKAGGGGTSRAVGVGIFASDVDTEDFSAAGTATVLPGAGRAHGALPAFPSLPAPPPPSSTALSAPTLPLSAAAGAATKPERVLDLEALSFTSGAHLMTNKRVELPDKSWRAQKKGYEEVHVPALKPKPLGAEEREVPIAELPEWAQPAFKGMAKLNRVQSRLYETAMFSPENLLLCAPTGAGKTNVAVLAILHELGLHRSPDTGALDTSAFKIVYIAPMKALVQEVVANFTQRLSGPFGLTVRELSGDVNLTKAEIAETQVIVTTPEKWDVITRKSGDRTYTQLVRLVIIDEVHLLHDERGAVLEALVARTLRAVETSQEMVRIVGLSATLPNYEDVATFLRVKPGVGLFYFDNSFRPCPLQQAYIGITEKKPMKKYALMNDITYEKVEEQAGKNQVLVFVHSRKETAKTARALRDAAVAKDALSRFLREDSASREILVTEAETSAKDADLKDLLPYGFAVHHAGMARADRTLVEELFADGHVQVLVSTATLAWGVNLPAHTVVIKGTQVYSPEKGRWVELSPLDMMQMLGRAGRPQYDTYGEGVIITGHSELQFYLSLLNQQLPIESQLVAKLADNLNAEIVLGTIANVREAATWLGYTYLYVRMLRNPGLYGASPEELAADPLLLQRRLDLAHSAAAVLDRHNLVRYDKRTGAFQSTALGRVASHYYVTHGTVATYNEFLKPTLSDIELFRLFALSSEFKHIVVRQEEKEELRKLSERVPVPIKESLEEPSAKVNVLLQAYVSGLRLEGFALASDMVFVQQSAGRLLRAIFEICLRRGWAALANRALTLCKMIDHRQWQSASPLRQFPPGSAPGVSEEVLRKLEKKDIAWERYYDLKPADLGELVRLPKLGKALHRLIHAIPRLELSAAVQPITRSLLKVDLTLTPDFVFDVKLHTPSLGFLVLVEDTDGEVVLHSEAFSLRAAYAEEPHSLTFYVPLTDPLPPQYFVRVVSERWLHSETLLALPFRHLILPDKFPPHTELLDLAPLPLSALRHPAFEALYSTTFAPAAGEPQPPPLKHFNPIQTQAFGALYEADGNVVVAAPSGSGKTLCAEFALLRLFAGDPEARAVYVAPRPEVVRLRLEEWELKFGAGLGKAVVELTGELAADLKLCERAHIVLATPRQWDAVSRRWKKRRAVGEGVGLFIADELEAIGGAAAIGGPTYEIVVSRMRFIAAQRAGGGGPPLRLVGLATSVANARDLGDWIGAGAGGTFNFHPQVRPVPLEIRLQGFDIAAPSARLMAMARPAYSACAAYAGAPGKPALVFVPSRKQAQLTAIDLITFAAADGAGDRFRRGRASAETLAAAVAQAGVRDGGLAACLAQGVGVWHEGLSPAERALVARLYASDAIGVVVATSSASWGMGGAAWGAALVVILGTEAYDGREHRFVDYPIADVLHMMGRASRPGRDDCGRVVILCAAARKEYLKRFLYDPLPVESHLNHALHDHIAAEVVNRVIENKQDALDYLTWSFMYRRLGANPHYYGLGGASHRHLSDFLSELVDSVLGDLEASQCIAIADEVDVSPLNLGMIASYYYVAYTSLELFASSLTAKTKTKGLLEILCAASEFEELPMRQGEDRALRALATHAPLALPALAPGKPSSGQFHDPHIKANLLLQAHFSRRAVGPELRGDAASIVEQSITLLQALVDVISSEGWLKPALAAMELSQMAVQALWADKDSVLQQAPHVTREVASRLEALAPEPVETVFDLAAMEPELRRSVTGLSHAQLADVARFCNRYPNVDVGFVVAGNEGGAQGATTVAAGGSTSVRVSLAREEGAEGLQEGAGLGAVLAPLFPKPKTEGWWLVVGDAKTNAISAIKRVALGERASVNLEFPTPTAPGLHELTLYFMCDSYLGCDQEYQFTLNVVGAGEGAGEGEGDVDMDGGEAGAARA